MLTEDDGRQIRCCHVAVTVDRRRGRQPEDKEREASTAQGPRRQLHNGLPAARRTLPRRMATEPHPPLWVPILRQMRSAAAKNPGVVA